MGQFVWLEQVSMLGTVLATLEGPAAKERLAGAGLEELKSALDDLRLRAWGLLMATNADDPHGFQERFRTLRGTEMCRSITSDLRTGKLSGRPAELPALGSAAQDLAVAVKESTKKPSKKRPKK